MSTDKKISELPLATAVSASDISVLVNNGSDYQYTFTILLQFLQANLATGANISFGTVLPQNIIGKNGDVFVNTSSGAFAQKVSGTWTIVYTLPTANAADGALLYGAGLPASATGKDLDSYINTLTGIFYKKSTGAWSQVFSMATGPQGPRGIAGTNGTNGVDGNTILFGTTTPSNTLTGVNGNFYINTTTFTFFGPKTAGVWGQGTSLLGTGLPIGGATGQVLAKVDGTDGNVEWINPPAGGSVGGGYTARTFDEILTFDVNFKMSTNQTADIDFVLGSDPVDDVIARVIITGDGTHACSFPSDWINANGQTFDNTKRNIIFLEYDGTEILYSIIKVETPDVTAPALVSATIENTGKNKIVLTYSELLASIVPNISDYVINLSNVITSIVVAGSTVTIACTDNFTNTDVVTVSYTPGTNKIQDAAGNLAAALITHAITNNVSVENRSLSVLAANQIPGTSSVPSNLAFGSGGSGGSDTPVSISFWFKDVAVSGTKIGFSFLRPGSALSCGLLNIMTSGTCAFYMAGNGGINVEHLNISNTVALTRAVWNHIVFTYDGGKALTGMRMYVNGTLVAIDANSNGTYNGQVALNSDHQLQIGGGNLLGTQTIFGGGLIDEFYWFNKELSSGEVSELYNSGNIIDNPSSLSFATHLKAGYKFDNDLGDLGNSDYDLSSTAAPTFSTDAL